MELHAIGIDLGKTVFHLVGVNLRGEVVVRKKFSRKQLLHFTANLQVELIGMEACGGAHFLGRALREQGHEVRLMPAQYVKPYVKTNKSDYIDAEAIAEAVGRPKMRFVPIKSDDQLDLQSLHRVRERWVMRRTAVINKFVACCSNVESLCERDGAMSMRPCPGYWKTPTPSYQAHSACSWHN
jgi:transposase